MPIDDHHEDARFDGKNGTAKTVLVFGATGQQGGAVASALRSDGWAVRALVRNPESDRARTLASIGVELHRGDMSDKGSIEAAMRGAYGVFSVQPSSGQGAAYGTTDEEEVRYGKAIADIALASGVRHLVYSSTNAAGSGQTGMSHFDSKSAIEAHIGTLDIRSTIVRPAAFMELLVLPGMGLDRGEYTFFLKREQKGQVIAVSDIGRIVAGIFASPDRYAGRAFEIAGDELTGAALEPSFSRAAGHSIRYSRLSDGVLVDNDFLRRLTDLFDDRRLAGRADIDGLRHAFGPLLSLDDWLDGPGRPLLKAALQAGDTAIALR